MNNNLILNSNNILSTGFIVDLRSNANVTTRRQPAGANAHGNHPHRKGIKICIVHFAQSAV